MRLKSIKLAGFKSFVDPTNVNFPSNLCAVVGPNGPGSLKELAQMVRSNPGKYNYAHVGRGTIQHLTMEIFLSMIGAQVEAVPYKGSVQAITDIIGGQIPMMFDSPSSASAVARSFNSASWPTL